MSRTRLVRPGFFGDEDIATMSRDSRLAYLGLTTECDDAGYFERRPRQLARALFGFDADGVEVVEQALADLERLGKVTRLACGEHGIVPSLPVHAQQGGNKAFNHQAAHAAKCESEQVRTRHARVPTAAPATPVRSRPDKSRSESVSDSESVTRREKKDVLEEGVERSNGARDAEAAPFLSDPNRAGRPGASSVPSPRPPALTMPAGLAAVTPKWRHPCTDYTRHQSKHRIVDGVAVCDPCEEAIAAAANGSVPAEPANLWGPVQ